MCAAPLHEVCALRSLLRAGVRRAQVLTALLGLSLALMVAASPAIEPVMQPQQRILIEFSTRPDAEALQALAAEHGLQLVKILPSSPVAVFGIDAIQDAAAVIKQLQHEPGVTNAEFDQTVSPWGSHENQ